MSRIHLVSLTLAIVLILAPLGRSQGERTPSAEDSAAAFQGDRSRVDWVRPFSRAREAARTAQRVLLIKPILGGSNTPDPSGVPCGGTNDCEGSW